MAFFRTWATMVRQPGRDGGSASASLAVTVAQPARLRVLLGDTLIPTFASSNPLTGRTDRLHIIQTLVPSHRAQVFS